MLGLLPILRKNQCLIIHFVLVGRICGRAGVAWSLRLRVLEGLPAIKEGEAAVNGLGVTIIPIAILVLEVIPETTKTLTIHAPLSIRAVRNSSLTDETASARSASVGLEGSAMSPLAARSLILVVRKVGTTPTTPMPP
jgi:hypothetical protein